MERQRAATASGQHPLAVILVNIDSRSPAEAIFDLGPETFSVFVWQVISQLRK